MAQAPPLPASLGGVLRLGAAQLGCCPHPLGHWRRAGHAPPSPCCSGSSYPRCSCQCQAVTGLGSGRRGTCPLGCSPDGSRRGTRRSAGSSSRFRGRRLSPTLGRSMRRTRRSRIQGRTTWARSGSGCPRNAPASTPTARWSSLSGALADALRSQPCLHRDPQHPRRERRSPSGSSADWPHLEARSCTAPLRLLRPPRGPRRPLSVHPRHGPDQSRHRSRLFGVSAAEAMQ